MPSSVPIVGAVRGRGAKSNRSGRFEAAQRDDLDDGWTSEDAEPQPLRTTVTAEKAKVIITHNDSPDVGFSASINPYRGCEHDCIYWHVTHCYRAEFVNADRIGAGSTRRARHEA